MAGSSSEGEVNHWPAFVDVLTTVIMVVSFLLVIMSAAVMVLSQRVIKEIELKAAQAGHPMAGAAPGAAAGSGAAAGIAIGQGHNAPVRSPAAAPDGSSVAELGAVLKIESPPDGDERLSIRTRDTPETLKLAVKAVEVPRESKGVAVTTADTLLKVSFEPDALNYDDGTTKKVVEFLHAHPNPGVAYEIWSFVPQTGSVSEAQRVAFYRAAMTRNLLVKAGVAPKSILTQIRIIDPKQPDGHTVRVVLKP